MNRRRDKKTTQMWLLFKTFNVILSDVKIQAEVLAAPQQTSSGFACIQRQSMPNT